VHAPNDSKGASLPSFGKKNNLGSKLFAIEIKKKKGRGGGGILICIIQYCDWLVNLCPNI